MHPILFSIFGLNISSLGAFCVVALILGLFLFFKETHNEFNEDDIFDAFFLSIFSGLFGSRVFYVLMNWEKFAKEAWRIIFINATPGFNLYGGLIFGFLALYFFCRHKKISFPRFADAVSEGLVLAILLGKIGIFLDGGAVGCITNLPWGLPTIGYEGNRHPVPLYWAIYFLFSLIVLLKIKRQNPPIGSLFLAFLSFLGMGMTTLAFLKEEMIYWQRVPVEGLFGACLFSGSIILLYKRLGRQVKNDIRIVISKIKGQISKLGKIKNFLFEDVKIKFPPTILRNIEQFLKREEAKTKEELSRLSKEDPFNDTERLIDNAATDTEAKEQAGHQRIEAIKNELGKTLVRIRKALTKIKIGKYGMCENCGKMIDTERLAAIPTAVLCVDCQKKKEKSG